MLFNEIKTANLFRNKDYLFSMRVKETKTVRPKFASKKKTSSEKGLIRKYRHFASVQIRT